MNYKTSNGQTAALCSGVIENDDGYLPQPIIDMRKIDHLSRLLDFCPGTEKASDLKPAHAIFWGIFCKMKAVILKDGSMVLASRSKKGLHQFRMGRWLFIEQNPKTGSSWAEMVAAGHRIMWIIDVEAANNTYVARVVDGKITAL